MARKTKDGRALKTYRSYLFLEKDPIIDALRTAVSDSHRSYRHISDESGVASTTMSNWFSGTTRRPQFATAAAVLRSLGKTGVQFDKGGKPRLTE